MAADEQREAVASILARLITQDIWECIDQSPSSIGEAIITAYEALMPAEYIINYPDAVAPIIPPPDTPYATHGTLDENKSWDVIKETWAIGAENND